jgi:hypothetical protein
MRRTTNLPTGLAALPRTIRKRLTEPERPEDGGWHKWMLTTAMAIMRFVSREEAIELIREHLPRSENRPTEVEEQVDAAVMYRESGQLNGSNRRQAPKFAMDADTPAKVLELAVGGINMELLRSLSPTANTADLPTAKVLRALFPGNPLICAGQYFHRASTQALSNFHPRYLSRCSFVVPNPMTALTGRTKFGQESARCETNVGPRWYGVVESDIKTVNPRWLPILEEAEAKGITAQDLGAATLLAVSDETGIPLTAVVHSGDVSLHGWFHLEGMSYDQQRRFYETSSQWGGDPATWIPHQWVRMPNGIRWREDENRSKPATEVAPQRLEYFNPDHK